MTRTDKLVEDWECDTQSNPKVDKDELIGHIIRWLDDNIDEAHTIIAQDSADLKQKIELYLEGIDEFG